MSSKYIFADKTIKKKTIGIASSLLTSLLNWINEDGSLSSNGDANLLTHHLLLVLSVWQNEKLKGVEDRAVRWLIDYDDYREKKENDFNPFKLVAFASLGRSDLEEYVNAKVNVLRTFKKTADGFTVLDLGFKLAGDTQAVFPTLVASEVLIKEGSKESLDMASKCLKWSKKQIEGDVVYENVYSINGFAALVISLYEQVTNNTEFSSWRDNLIERIISMQENGLWHVEEKGIFVESKYQSSYLFYDLACIFSLVNSDHISQPITHFIERLNVDFLEGKEFYGQHMMLIVASVLRGLAFLLSHEEKDVIVQNVIDSCVQISGEYNRNRNSIHKIRSMQKQWLEDIDNKNYIYSNPTVFHKRGFEVDEKQVFIVMPFGEKEWFDNKTGHEKYDFDRLHSNIIQKAISDVELYPLRADNIYAPHSFMQKIWKDINGSCLLIVDLTSGNPNVFYELGIAHTLGKPVILMAKNERYIPTDLKGNVCIIYGDRSDESVIEELSNAIKKMLGLT